MNTEQRDPDEPADTLAPSVDTPAPPTDSALSPQTSAATAPSTASIPTPTATVTPSTSNPILSSAGIGELPGPAVPAGNYSAAGVPSLDFVRDKIEGRYATALGAGELAEAVPEVRSAQQQAAKREQAARDKLEEIRRSLRGGSSP